MSRKVVSGMSSEGKNVWVVICAEMKTWSKGKVKDEGGRKEGR